MLLTDIIRAKKSKVQWGPWKSGVVMPRTQFPLSKGSYRVRKCYNWNVSTFDCLNQSFRLLVFYQIAKEEYAAWLALAEGSDGRLIARLEFHASHPGWHLHTPCDTELTPLGRTGGSGFNRLPGAHNKHRRASFGITGNEVALFKAATVFRITEDGDDLFSGH